MYIPKHFGVQDTDELIRFIRHYSFGTMVTAQDGLFASHVPFLFREPGVNAIASPLSTPVLVGHLAKANPHWRRLDGAEVLVIFQGPHAYISL